VNINRSLQTSASSTETALTLNLCNSKWNGFNNLVKKEMDDWFHTRRWILQIIIWPAIINLFMAFGLFMAASISADTNQVAESASAPIDPVALGTKLFFRLVVVAGAIGTVILTQDEIVAEKRSGTAAWILSNPVLRSAFVLSKLVSNLIGILLFVVLIPALIGFIEIRLAAGTFPALLPFLNGIIVACLGLLFYLTLTIMLGVLFQASGPVLGISLGLLLGGLVMGQPIVQILPVALDKFSTMLAQGSSLPTVGVIEIAVTALWCVLFIVVALWRFEKLEL